MSLVDLDAVDFSPEDVLQHLKNNRPCVVRGFLSPEDVQMYLDHINSTNLKRYMIGNVPAYVMDKTDLAQNDYLDAFQEEPTLLHANYIRVWKHNAKNLTRWHYDGNGADLLNISLQGKKRFYLAPPNSLPVYPLSNIAWRYDFKETHIVEIEAGDMLFLPAYWFHKVLTLKNDTININYTMYNKENHKYASLRDKEIFGLHNMFGTSMDKEILSVYQNENSVACLARGLYEILVFIAIFVIFYAASRKYKQFWMIKTLLLVGLISGLYLYFNKELSIDTNGITHIIGFYILVLTSFFFIYEWNEHQSDYIML